VAFEFDDQSPIPMALHRNDKDLQICFEFLSTTPVAGDLLAIFSVEDAAAEKLSHPKAVACIAADVGQRVARVDFKSNYPPIRAFEIRVTGDRHYDF
jgi:hypothetical protein